MEEKITLILDGKGHLEIETNGIKGAGCEKVVDRILVGVNAEPVETKRTHEFFEDGGDDPVKVLSNL